MLADEIKSAAEEVVLPHLAEFVLTRSQEEPFKFKYYLVLTRTYHLSPEELEILGHNPDRSKRRKGPANAAAMPRFFHPEDEQFQRVRISFYMSKLIVQTCGVGVDVFRTLSFHKCSTKRGKCLRT